MEAFVLDERALDVALNKTGFPTEYKIQRILENHNWKVISNRYYIDDQKKIEREIDLLATKGAVNLIISCKKSDSEFWAFMTSESLDVNVPLLYKSEDPIMDYFWTFENDTFRRILSKHQGLNNLLNTTDMVRAFQQIKITNYDPNNDKHIYDSVITTIKAADYEASHARSDAAYFMLSVFEGEMVKKDFGTETSSAIDNIIYVNRHFIGDEDKYYSVHFIKYDAFERMVVDYDMAVDELPCLINDLHEEFGNNAFAHQSRLDRFWECLENDFFHGLYDQYGHLDSVFSSLSTNPTSIRPYFSKSGKLHLAFNLFLFSHRAAYASEINQDAFCRELMADLLKKYFNYEGTFIIENDPGTEENDENRFMPRHV